MRSWSHGFGLTAGRRCSAPVAAQVSDPTWQSQGHSAGRARLCCGRPCSAFPPCGQRQRLRVGLSLASPALLPLPSPGTHFLQMCWDPLRYSCSKAGRTSWWRLKRLCSMRVSTGVGGSRHSGMNTMKDRGSGELSSSFCGRGHRVNIRGQPPGSWQSGLPTPPQHQQQTHLEVRNHGIHELLAERRVGLKGTTQWGEVQAGPRDRGEHSKSHQGSVPQQKQVPPPPLGSHIKEMALVRPEANTHP